MKPAALKSKKELALGEIEANLDKLLKAKGVSYEKATPPVRRPEFRELQALDRINSKLALVMEAEQITPDDGQKAAVIGTESEGEPTAQPAEESLVPTEPAKGEAESAPDKPAKSKKK